MLHSETSVEHLDEPTPLVSKAAGGGPPGGGTELDRAGSALVGFKETFLEDVADLSAEIRGSEVAERAPSNASHRSEDDRPETSEAESSLMGAGEVRILSRRASRAYGMDSQDKLIATKMFGSAVKRMPEWEPDKDAPKTTFKDVMRGMSRPKTPPRTPPVDPDPEAAEGGPRLSIVKKLFGIKAESPPTSAGPKNIFQKIAGKVASEEDGPPNKRKGRSTVAVVNQWSAGNPMPWMASSNARKNRRSPSRPSADASSDNEENGETAADGEESQSGGTAFSGQGMGAWQRTVKKNMAQRLVQQEMKDIASDVSIPAGALPPEEPETPPHWSKMFIIGIENPVRVYWDMSQVIVLGYVAIAVPLEVAFRYKTFGLVFWIEVLVDVYFYIDIIINFFSMVRIESELEVEFLDTLPRIAYHYVRTWLIIDVAACLPLDYITRAEEGQLICSFAWNGCSSDDSEEASLDAADSGPSESSALKLLKLFRIFRLLKLMRLTRIVRILDRYQDKLVYWQHFLVCTKVFSVVMLFSHWLGCIYGAVYEWHEADEEPDLAQKWVSCFYWAIQTITTVGYGDRYSSTIKGQLVSVLGMSVGGVIFSWFMSNIFSLLNPDPSKEKHQEKMQYVVTYLQSNSLPIEVAARVLAFYRKQASASLNFDEEKLLNQLPFHLRQELFDYLYGHIIRSIPLFEKQEDRFIQELCFSVSPVACDDWQLVYQMGDLGVECYILVEGEIIIMKDANRRHIIKGILYDTSDLEANTTTTYKSKGSYFGEGTALGFHERTEYAVVKVAGKLLSLPAEQFRALLDLYPAVHESLLIVYLSRLRHFTSAAMQKKVLSKMGMNKLLDSETNKLRRDFKKIIMQEGVANLVDHSTQHAAQQHLPHAPRSADHPPAADHHPMPIPGQVPHAEGEGDAGKLAFAAPSPAPADASLAAHGQPGPAPAAGAAGNGEMVDMMKAMLREIGDLKTAVHVLQKDVDLIRTQSR